MRKIYVAALTTVLAIGMGITLVPKAEAAWGDVGTILGGKRLLNDGQKANIAQLNNPKGIAIEKRSGDIYIADTRNNRIAKIDGTTKKISTFVNISGNTGTQDGSRLGATLDNPYGVAIDSRGAVYIADTYNGRIRKVEGDKVSTIVSKGLKLPEALTVRGDTVYISDTGNNRVVSVNKNGGKLQRVGGVLSIPRQITWNQDKLYVVCAGDGTINEINLSTNTSRRYVGGFEDVGGIAIKDSRTMFVAAGKQGVWNELFSVDRSTKTKTLLSKDRETETLNWAAGMALYNNRIYIIYQGGASIYSANLEGEDMRREAGKYRYPKIFGSAAVSQIGRPHSIVWNPTKPILYAAINNQLIEYNTVSGKVRFMAGHPMDNYVEGQGSSVRFSNPDIDISPDGNWLYIADQYNHRIRKMSTKTKKTEYITGAGEVNFYSPNYSAYQEGGPCDGETGANKSGCAYFNKPSAIVVNRAGTKAYVTDSGNNMLREINLSTGKTRKLAGTRSAGFKNGFGPLATFNGPADLDLDAAGANLYVADKGNHAIRRINLATLNVSTVVGKGKPGYQEGSKKTALLQMPTGIEVRGNNMIFWSESGSQRIRMYNTTENQTRLFAGSGKRGRLTGPSTRSQFNEPKGLAINPKDGSKLYIADYYNDSIKVGSLR